jgi:hypothetical protein
VSQRETRCRNLTSLCPCTSNPMFQCTTRTHHDRTWMNRRALRKYLPLKRWDASYSIGLTLYVPFAYVYCYLLHATISSIPSNVLVLFICASIFICTALRKWNRCTQRLSTAFGARRLGGIPDANSCSHKYMNLSIHSGSCTNNSVTKQQFTGTPSARFTLLTHWFTPFREIKVRPIIACICYV